MGEPAIQSNVEFTDQETLLFDSLDEAFGSASDFSPILCRSTLDGKDVAVIAVFDPNEESARMWPVAILVNKDMHDRLTVPEGADAIPDEPGAGSQSAPPNSEDEPDGHPT